LLLVFVGEEQQEFAERGLDWQTECERVGAEERAPIDAHGPPGHIGALERGVQSLAHFAALGDLGEGDAATLAHISQLLTVRESRDCGRRFARGAIGNRR
jgi:hypothetical protein